MSMVEPQLPSVSSPVSAVAWQGLRSVSWLESLSDERLSVLAGQCLWHRLESGQVLHGAYTDQRMYMLINGQLSVGSYSASGRAMILGYLEPGFFLVRSRPSLWSPCVRAGAGHA
jgi:hypothetical protein